MASANMPMHVRGSLSVPATVGSDMLMHVKGKLCLPPSSPRGSECSESTAYVDDSLTLDFSRVSSLAVSEQWAASFSPRSAALPADSSNAADSAMPALNKNPVFPSLGSAQHLQGDCKPCVWYWKPQGCRNGEQCLHCHLCPEGEVKSRKRVKIAAARELRKEMQEGNVDDQQPNAAEVATNAEAASVIEDGKEEADEQHPCAPTLGARSPEVTLVDAPPLNVQQVSAPPGLSAAAVQSSLGSEAHKTGDCKPCVWFWKPQGCMNGQLCLHCHLCPPGENKARRKARAARQQTERVPGLHDTLPLSGGDPQWVDLRERPWSIAVHASDPVPPVGPPPGLDLPAVPYASPALLAWGSFRYSPLDSSRVLGKASPAFAAISE